MILMILFTIITFSSSPVSEISNFSKMILWNVGQGQWLTYVHPRACLHFDIGGEFFPLKKIENFCKSRPNLVYISHWDWDHISGIKKLNLRKEFVRTFCLADQPAAAASEKKQLFFREIPKCSPEILQRPLNKPQKIKTLHTPNTRAKKMDSNSQSGIFIYSQTLIPGDSPHQILSKSLVRNGNVQNFILSHHGSKTGLHLTVLDKIPEVRQAFASARWAKYKHPHPLVLDQLRRHHIPLLKTEDWGNIYFDP